MSQNNEPQGVLILDINSIPTHMGLDAEQVLELYQKEKIVVYSSITEDGQKAEKPEFIPLKDIEVSFLDVSKQENMKKLNNYRKRLK